MWVLFGLFFMLSNFFPVDLDYENYVSIEHLGGSMSTNWIENGPPLIQFMLEQKYPVPCMLGSQYSSRKVSVG